MNRFLTQFAAIAVGAANTILAARRGLAGPLEILSAYLVTGITEPRSQWMSPSVTGRLLILAVVQQAFLFTGVNKTTEPALEWAS
jgi:hypothetical protein